MEKRSIYVLGILLFLLFIITLFSNYKANFIGRLVNKISPDKTDDNLSTDEGGLTTDINPLAIASLRASNYPGSDIVIEETLDQGSNYNRYLTSYRSEGLKIYALLTVPQGTPPDAGWPVVVFNHGYIPPREYRTTERYIAYVDGFARNGYIVFRPDYRGHGDSDGEATGGYGSNAYTIDVLNAVESVKRLNEKVPVELLPHPDPDLIGADPLPEGEGIKGNEERKNIVDINKMGMWGHSMGGFITLRFMVTSKAVKAGVIWAGVVASYPDLITKWRRSSNTSVTPSLPQGARRWRQVLVEQFGEPSNDSPFWQSISANFFLKDISGPLQLHHGTADTSVPVAFSEDLEKQMNDAGKEVELYIYDGDDHNISANITIAMQRSIEFFDKYLK